MVLDVLGEPLTPANLAGAALRMWAKLGTALGYGEDNGLSEKQRDIVASFFEDGDPAHTRMRLAIGALQDLIIKDGISELQPYIDTIMGLLIDKANEQNA